MRASDFGLLFAIIFMIYIGLDTTNSATLAKSLQLQNEYNLAVDNAVEAALYQVIEVDDRGNPCFNHQVVINRFFQSMYSYLGMMENPDKKQLLQCYVPFIILIDINGLVVYYQEEDGTKVFSNAYSFFYEGEEGTLYVTLGKYVTYISKDKTQKQEGYYEDVKSELPDELIWTDEIFEENRRNVIVAQIETVMLEYLEHHNQIAEQLGITYHFSLPTIEKEEWYRTIDDIGMIAFIQGYPYGNGITGTYNRMALGAARLKKAEE